MITAATEQGRVCVCWSSQREQLTTRFRWLLRDDTCVLYSVIIIIITHNNIVLRDVVVVRVTTAEEN